MIQWYKTWRCCQSQMSVYPRHIVINNYFSFIYFNMILWYIACWCDLSHMTSCQTRFPLGFSILLKFDRDVLTIFTILSILKLSNVWNIFHSKVIIIICGICFGHKVCLYNNMKSVFINYSKQYFRRKQISS